jgi:hypothetical protein
VTAPRLDLTGYEDLPDLAGYEDLPDAAPIAGKVAQRADATAVAPNRTSKPYTMATGIGTELLQGGSGEWADEALPGPIQAAYRQRRQAFKDDHPVLAPAANIIGMALPVSRALRVLKGAKGVIGGAGLIGGLQGAGAAEEGDRLVGGAKGAAIGSGLAAAGLGAQALSRVAEKAGASDEALKFFTEEGPAGSIRGKVVNWLARPGRKKLKAMVEASAAKEAAQAATKVAPTVTGANVGTVSAGSVLDDLHLDEAPPKPPKPAKPKTIKAAVEAKATKQARGKGANYTRDATVMENLAKRAEKAGDPVKAAEYRAKADAVRAKVPKGVAQPANPDPAPDDDLETLLRLSLKQGASKKNGFNPLTNESGRIGPEGDKVRLYRVEAKDHGSQGNWLQNHLKPDEWEKFTSERGRLFADNLDVIKKYGVGEADRNVFAVDVPKDIAKSAARQHPDGFTEYLLPPEIVANKKLFNPITGRLTEEGKAALKMMAGTGAAAGGGLTIAEILRAKRAKP